VLAQYGKLSESEIKQLVVEDKWFAALQDAIEGEIQRVMQRLAGRIKELEERYAEPLPQIEQEVEIYAARVAEHLKRMGVELP
jgi:type I restriction enzyme M protein